MKVADFTIDTEGFLTDTDPAVYNKVILTYRFFGDNLNQDKLTKVVNLSVDKHCGVLQMFRAFATVEIVIQFNE